MKKHALLFVCCASLFAACKKNTDTTPSAPKSSADFIKNTEWVGTLDRNGFEYPPPCALKFHDDNTFTMYSHFIYFSGNAETRMDSIAGVIESIDDLPDGRIRITTNINTTFRPVTTNYIYISDRKNIVGMSADASQEPTFFLQIFPEKGFSLRGTHWRGPEWHSTASVPNYAYPDLDNITFMDDGINTVYSLNGQPVFASENTPLQHIYGQTGSRVYFSGYTIRPGGAAVNVNNYFGVLLPSGDAMLVDSYSPDAHLPNYVNTFEPYGQNGVTPTIYKY